MTIRIPISVDLRSYVLIFISVGLMALITYYIGTSIYNEIQRTQPIIDNCRITQGELPCKLMNETCREALCVMPNSPIINWLPILAVVIVAGICLYYLLGWFSPNIPNSTKQKTIEDYKKMERKYRKDAKENLKFYSAKWGYTFREGEK